MAETGAEDRPESLPDELELPLFGPTVEMPRVIVTLNPRRQPSLLSPIGPQELADSNCACE